VFVEFLPSVHRSIKRHAQEKPMNRLAWTIIFTLLLAPGADASRKSDAAACAEVKEKIRTIESRMRAGYTRAQGERYEERLRELRAKRREICR